MPQYPPPLLLNSAFAITAVFLISLFLVRNSKKKQRTQRTPPPPWPRTLSEALPRLVKVNRRDLPNLMKLSNEFYLLSPPDNSTAPRLWKPQWRQTHLPFQLRHPCPQPPPIQTKK